RVGLDAAADRAGADRPRDRLGGALCLSLGRGVGQRQRLSAAEPGQYRRCARRLRRGDPVQPAVL
ncbi:hypothetical protein LTR94_036367, partial [Friedmanniomyces endolithicus]